MNDQKSTGVRASDVELPPSMADVAYARKRYAKLADLTAQHHKHFDARLQEKAELAEILEVFGGIDDRDGTIAYRPSEGGAA